MQTGSFILVALVVTLVILLVLALTIWHSSSTNVPTLQLTCESTGQRLTATFSSTQTLDIHFNMGVCDPAGQFATFLLEKSSLPQEFTLVTFQNPTFAPDQSVPTQDANYFFLNGPSGQDKPHTGSFRIQFSEPLTTFTQFWNGD